MTQRNIGYTSVFLAAALALSACSEGGRDWKENFPDPYKTSDFEPNSTGTKADECVFLKINHAAMSWLYEDHNKSLAGDMIMTVIRGNTLLAIKDTCNRLYGDLDRTLHLEEAAVTSLFNEEGAWRGSDTSYSYDWEKISPHAFSQIRHGQKTLP